LSITSRKGDVSAEEGPKEKNKKNVMPLSEKMEVLDKVDRGIKT
jgi:hypothetical protein